MITFWTEWWNERVSAHVRSFSFHYKMFRVSQQNGVHFSVSLIVSAVYGNGLFFRAFTTINKRFNAEVTCIPNSRVHYFTNILFVWGLFFVVRCFRCLTHCSFVTCNCNLIVFTFYALFAYFTFISCLFEIRTRATDKTCATLKWINREISTSHFFLLLLHFRFISFHSTF